MSTDDTNHGRRDLHVVGDTDYASDKGTPAWGTESDPFADDTNPDIDPPPAGPSAPESAARWMDRDISTWFRARWREATGDGDYWPPGWLTVLGVGLVALVVIFGILAPIIEALAAATPQVITWLEDSDLVGLITDPVHEYLTTHAAAVPLAGQLLSTGWAVAGVGFFLWSWIGRSFGARIGWVLIGAATTGMVYTATEEPSQTVAAGVTVLIWAVASIAAFRGVGRRTDRTIIYPPPDPNS